MSEPKIKYVCPECGSEDVTRDGILRWDAEAQDWETSSTLDNMDCQNCGYDGDSWRFEKVIEPAAAEA